ncbi:DUF2235 domain-containing protein [Moritella sp. 28]|uniref:phospholipase effector Tle1 domain-containing protein n=1 Tax=Moritella sp. 28 TaxID=2746232 RepID=UPI001BA4B051|nr:DUF2235 domain-containing protein [Moritella sp. 28]QUM86318.1 DUF2235 domain-containing protein [Moritella sp. 28]
MWEILDKTQPKRQVVYYDEGVGSDWYNSLIGMIYSCGLLNKDRLTETAIEHAFDVYKHADNHEKNSFKQNNIMCQIEVIGVWDTVGSLGIPIGFLKEITYQYLQFHDTKLNKDALH